MEALIPLLIPAALVVLAHAIPLRRARLASVGAACLASGMAGIFVLSERAWGAEPAPVTAEAESPTSAAALPASPATKPAELKIGATIDIPPGRPAWVEQDFTHDTGDIQRVAVSSGPHEKKQQALAALDEELELATRKYVTSYLGHASAGTLVPVDASYIHAHLLQRENIYSEVIGVSVGPMHQVHALIEFDDEFRDHIRARWQKIVVTGRTLKLGVIGGAVLLGLSIVFGYFKADTATRGHHSARLQFASAAALCALVAGGIFLVRWL